MGEETVESEHMPVKFILRPATLDDIELVLELNEQASIASTGKSYENRNQARVKLETYLTSSRYGILIAETEHGLNVGMTILDLDPEPTTPNLIGQPFIVPNEDHPEGQPLTSDEIKAIHHNEGGRRAHILSTAITKEEREKGYGKHIKAEMELILKQWGYVAITNDTGVDNIALQRSSKGFTFVREIPEQGSAYIDEKLIGAKRL